MAITYLKKSPKTSSTDDTKTREIVENILKDIETSKEEGCKELSKKFDKYEGDVIVCLLYTSPSPRDRSVSRMPSSA